MRRLQIRENVIFFKQESILILEETIHAKASTSVVYSWEKTAFCVVE